ncbi:hypothetical protein POM88_034125 [Heracleum sosnowskyi]|uniref:DUF8039 domain-containing protein n=1 Tax=Heracleum sosnowskyi TaxID=360622 RepID=A0AAD8HJT0_9APIA|nr:hypothetical protein POM88_034124 [Heracleum sosnowskyi]KAK1368033.1 hypothetical protein POM88_034125 [Heracleum sosnowskyi]
MATCGQKVVSSSIVKDLDRLLVDDDDCLPIKPIPLENKGPRKCELGVDTVKNKVAFGLLFDDEGMNSFIHGVPMQPGFVRVLVDGPIKDDALIPVPVVGEIEIVDQDVGSHISWPWNLIIINAPSIARVILIVFSSCRIIPIAIGYWS